MAHLIRADNSLQAWQAAVSYLAANRREAFNLLIEIDSIDHDKDWLARYNPKAHSPGAMSASDVANTIFPESLYRRFPDRHDLYAQYLRLHRRARRMRRSRAWGAYFERLISFDSRDDVNQLEKCIGALSNWKRSSRAGLVLHLSSPLDNPRPLGAPCWQFGELTWHQDNRVDFVVVYRNHDYFNKALPNFIGLSRLLRFICEQSGKVPGKIVCHAVHAYFDPSADFMQGFAA